jgi:hypothetical protein
LDYPRDETKTLLKAAFEQTRGIAAYHDNGTQIVGKTGGGFSSHGEQVIAEIPENQSSNTETMVSVTAEKEVSVNVTASPQKHQSEFLTAMEHLRGKEIDTVLSEMSDQMSPEQSKEVLRADQMPDGSSSVGKSMLVAILVTFLMMFFIMVALSP